MAAVRTLEAEKSAQILEAALASHVRAGKGGDLTIADAAAKAGLALRDAELGLHHLSSKYRGRLSATEKGELLFRFPYGFSLPLTKRPAVIEFFAKLRRGILGVAKFTVRAWITVVLVGYVGVFLAVLLALMFGGRSEDRGSSGGAGGLIYVLVRVLAEALFWTFHPFSPWSAYGYANTASTTSAGAWGQRQQRRGREQKVPFYERVNRFVFGPEEKKPDAREMERRILAHIRANQGRLAIGDVIRVTGLGREEADPLMARLMLDYDGDVEVSDDGAIFYKFPALRKTAAQTIVERPPPPVWSEKATAPPVTGNDSSSNFLIGALNAFNLVMAFVALQMNLTIERLVHMFTYMRVPPGTEIPILPVEGTPIILGLVPLVFSSMLFALPLWRRIRQGAAEKKAAEENARRAVLKTVLDAAHADRGVTDDELKKVWAEAAGSEPSDKKIVEQVVALGGDVDLKAAEEGGRAQYRFRDLEAEVEALKAERAQASDAEKEAGVVVFRA